MSEYSIYLHIPFCRHRCAYCDFNTYAGLDELVPAYVQAIVNEIEFLDIKVEEHLQVNTIFFGGGTPSLLTCSQLEIILECLERHFIFSPGIEISLEANPGTVTLNYLHDLHRLGINRLSLGMQSADTWELRLLERQHDFGDVIQAVSWARRAGFDNLNLDLIFGLPGQSLDSWRNNLSQAVRLRPDHLSLYSLTLEHGTPMRHWMERGLLVEPDPDLAADMYEWSLEYLEVNGYYQYEISNWAQKDHDAELKACRHNLQYWRNLPYLGFGAGAHGYAGGFRVANVLAPEQYIQRSHDNQLPGDTPFPMTPATMTALKIERSEEMNETMMVGLRLTQEGVSRTAFRERFQEELESIYSADIGDLIQLGLLEWSGEGGEILRLTPRGRLLGNQVFMRFVD